MSVYYNWNMLYIKIVRMLVSLKKIYLHTKNTFNTFQKYYFYAMANCLSAKFSLFQSITTAKLFKSRRQNNRTHLFQNFDIPINNDASPPTVLYIYISNLKSYLKSAKNPFTSCYAYAYHIGGETVLQTAPY